MAELLASRGEPADVGVGDAQVFVWIYGDIVDAHFVMEVRSSAAAAGADVADSIAPMEVLAGEDREAGQMSVTGGDAVSVVENYRAAVSAHEVGEFNAAVGWGYDRLSVKRA